MPVEKNKLAQYNLLRAFVPIMITYTGSFFNNFMLSSPDRYQPQRTTTAKGCDIMKEKAEFSFVILHYLVMDQTVNAVNSIKENMASYFFHIVIVDNGSPNESGRALEETCSSLRWGRYSS